VFRSVFYVSFEQTEEIGTGHMDSMLVCLSVQSKPTANLILVNVCEEPT